MSDQQQWARLGSFSPVWRRACRVVRGGSIALLALFAVFLSGCQSVGLSGTQSGTGEPIVVGDHEPGLVPAILEVPYSLEVLSVDGKSLPLFLRGSEVKLALPPGERVLGVRYFELWDVDSDSHEIVRSKTVRIRTTFLSGTRYALEAPPRFQTPELAQTYAETFKPKVFRHFQAVSVASVNRGRVQAEPNAEAAATREAATRAEVPVSVEPDVLESVATPVLTNGNEAPLVVEAVDAPRMASTGDAVRGAPAASGADEEYQSPLVESMKLLWKQLTAAERSAFQVWFSQQRAQH